MMACTQNAQTAQARGSAEALLLGQTGSGRAWETLGRVCSRTGLMDAIKSNKKVHERLCCVGGGGGEDVMDGCGTQAARARSKKPVQGKNTERERHERQRGEPAATQSVSVPVRGRHAAAHAAAAAAVVRQVAADDARPLHPPPATAPAPGPKRCTAAAAAAAAAAAVAACALQFAAVVAHGRLAPSRPWPTAEWPLHAAEVPPPPTPTRTQSSGKEGEGRKQVEARCLPGP